MTTAEPNAFPLAMADPEQRLRVVGLRAGRNLDRRLTDLGLNVGTELCVIQRRGGAEVELVDLPGTYSLDVTSEDVSLDEQIARDFVHAGEADLILNIVDASNLERNLYLTAQLLEMRRPLLVALNMTDMAEAAGMRVDAARLADLLGCPVVPVVASERRGIDALKAALIEAAHAPAPPRTEVRYDRALEQAIAALEPRLRAAADTAGDDARWLAARLLEADDLACRVAGAAVPTAELQTLRDALPDDVDILLADGRYGFANRLAQAAVRRPAQVPRSVSDRIDRVLLNRALGIPLFLGVMYLMFMFTINIGGAFIGQNVVFGLYLIGIAVAVLTGLVMKHTLLRGETTPFVMELPPYHLPALRGVLTRTWERTRGFVFRAGAIIVPMVLVLNFLNALGTDGSFGNADTDRSVLSGIGRGIAPAFSPMGLDEDNWPAAVGIFTGVLAKEAVVGTLDNIYSGLAAADAAAGTMAAEGADAAPAFALGPALTDALATIPAWIGAMLALLAAAVITLRWWGVREKQRLYRPAPEGAEA